MILVVRSTLVVRTICGEVCCCQEESVVWLGSSTLLIAKPSVSCFVLSCFLNCH